MESTAAGKNAGELTDSVYENYTPKRLNIRGAKPHPSNIAAIRPLKTIEDENRRATPDEQKLLERYVGRGCIKEAFQNPSDDPPKVWAGPCCPLGAVDMPRGSLSVSSRRFGVP